ncbi:ABC transporter ATP-binding protein [Eubacteriales bacterium OttesenSCG-928-N13]|nr:ABC transporter ATP-binding protein [Eubacteriales bacterium OttesenSCG-928-N13]
MGDKLILRDLVKQFGAVTAVDHINLSIAPGKLFSFLGPSGCGKTTTLRMIAGLETPDGGEIVVDGAVLSDKKHVTLPEKRNMGMMFQSYAVWPHMTVFDNVAYGLKLKKINRSDMQKKVNETLDLVGLSQYAERFPTQLSGGQQQRVALARALANEPAILLLDEPLCNLDAKLRENMRFEIRNLQQRLGITAVYVTHSQDEALAVSDEIVIMRDGKILQQGAPESIYANPNSSFVADFIGLINQLDAQVVSVEQSKTLVKLGNGQTLIAAKDDKQWKVGDHCKLLIRPENLMIDAWDQSKTYNSLDAQVERVSFTGSIVNYFLLFDGLDVSYRMQATPPVRFAQGQRMTCKFTPESCILTRD